MLESLFEPLRLGPVELACRIVSTAHQTTLVQDHLPTDDFVAYHEARARGGTGLIVLEATAPHPSGILTAARARRLPARDRPPPTAASAPPCSRTAQAVRSAPPRRPRADLRPAPRAGAGSVGDPEPALPGGAARAACPRDRRDRRGVRGVRRPRRARRARRHRDLRRAPLPGGAVLRPRAQPARRRMGRAVPLPARGRARRARGRTDSGARRAALGRLRARRSEWRRSWPGEVDYLSLALGDSPTYLGSTLIVPPPPLGESLIAGHARSVPGRAAADRDLARRRARRGRAHRSPRASPTQSA